MSVFKEAYHHYLTTDAWKATRERILQRRKRCVVCGTKDNLQIHHGTYKRVGCERDQDLIVLCKPCHEKVHKLGGGFRGVKLLKNPQKAAKEKKRKEKRRVERQQRKTFVVRMLSSPVKTFTPEEIKEYQKTLHAEV